ncbi:hypothetical protein ACSBM8_01840 [Sphingomonas sp. ASY06-1R]|jgi:hypothetical protein|uniref:hypothetical protein n=1 Tax=Sphingomonas sp. ASY06-1R TaxID=3445771 RepID=UPI003FA2599C
MRKTLPIFLLIALGLSACSKRDDSVTVGENSSVEMDGRANVAYGYTYRFGLPSKVVTQIQDRHIALCDQMGAARCRLQEMHRTTDQTSSSGSIKFLLASGDARPFGTALVAPVVAAGGALKSRDFEAEDVSKQIATSEKQTAAKPTAANQAALADVRERVVLSPVTVVYDNVAGFGEQVGNALSAAGETTTSSVAALIYFLAAAFPWAIVFAILFFGIRAIVRYTNRLFPRPSVSRRDVSETSPL